jgi:hypothetical protein
MIGTIHIQLCDHLNPSFYPCLDTRQMPKE